MSKQSPVQAVHANASQSVAVQSNCLLRQSTLWPHLCVQREAVVPEVEENAPSLVREVIDSPGRALDPDTRNFMEPRFGYDFSGVRVHTDDRAAESARSVNAIAYTTGSHMVFGEGEYAPNSPSGERLMAHELTHVVQQACGRVAGKPTQAGLAVSDPSDPFEQEATANADHVRTGPHERAPAQKELTQVPSVAAGANNLYVQRQPPPDPATQAAQSQAASAETANKIAGTGLGFAIGGFVVSLIGLVFAKQALNAARRQADAAEDPPVSQPTEGGVKSNHDEVPPVEMKAEETEKREKVIQKDITKEEIAHGRASKGDKVSVTISETESETIIETTKKAKSGAITTEKKTIPKKHKEKGESQSTFNILEIAEGKQNAAKFNLKLRFDGESIKGGNTEDGGILGYSGGSAASNASVTFKATPGPPVTPAAKDAAPVAAVRIRFAGYNTPPRMILKENEKPEKSPNLQQRFTGSMLFDATGNRNGPPALAVNPLGGSTNPRGPFGDGKSQPIISIRLNVPTSGPAKPEEGSLESPAAAAGTPTPPAK